MSTLDWTIFVTYILQAATGSLLGMLAARRGWSLPVAIGALVPLAVLFQATREVLQ